MKIKKIPIKIAIIFIISFSLILSPIFVFAEVTILSSPSLNDVIIDGKYSFENEWEDAAEFTIKKGMYVFGHILIKDDEDSLYVLIDYTSDKIVEDGDMAIVRIHMGVDKAISQNVTCGCLGFIPGPSPQTSDYSISLEWNNGTVKRFVNQGNGTGWTQVENIILDFSAASTNNAINDLYFEKPHLIYEFKISRGVFENSSKIGFYATAINEGKSGNNFGYINFPSYSHYLRPYTWAIISLKTLPQISNEVTVIGAQTLKKKFDTIEDFILIDGRLKKDYEKEHITGAISIPLDEVEEKAKLIIPNKSTEIITYCNNFDCPISTSLALILIDMGYENVTDYKGGLEDWKEVGYPTERLEISSTTQAPFKEPKSITPIPKEITQNTTKTVPKKNSENTILSEFMKLQILGNFTILLGIISIVVLIMITLRMYELRATT